MDTKTLSKPIPFTFEIEGATWLEELFVKDAFMAVYNGMCEITNGGGIDEFNSVFEKYYPDEAGCNDSLDNAYATLSFRVNKEIADKLSPILGMLPTGRCVYLDPEEPITIAGDFSKGWCHGYIGVP